MKKILIVGAGFSGLSLAYYLKKNGHAVTVVDRNKRVGGMIATGQGKYGLYETAANGFLNTRKVEEFLKILNISYSGSSETSKRRYVFRKRARRWPLTIFETLGFLVKLILFLSKQQSKKRPLEGESLEHWSKKNLGDAFTRYILAPALQGIYAGDLRNLSASLILNAILFRRKEKKLSPSSLLSSTEGMGSILHSLEKKLIELGVEFRYDSDFNSGPSSDVLVLATSAAQASVLLKSMNQYENAELINQIEMLPLMSATCFFSETPKSLKGFGILFPRGEGVRALGVLMNNMIFKRSENSHSETWIFGGALDAQVMQLTDTQIEQQIMNDRQLALGESAQALQVIVTRWAQALPHYSLALEKILKRLKPMDKIFLHGNYLGNLGLSRILEQSEKLADQIGAS